MYLGALSRVHALCGPLHEEAIAGTCRLALEPLTRVARAMLKGRTDALCPEVLNFAPRLANLADARSKTVRSTAAATHTIQCLHVHALGASARAARCCIRVHTATAQVNLDEMLELLLDTWALQRSRDDRAAEAACKAADPKGRGLFTAADFRVALTHLDASLGAATPQHVVLQLLREALQDCQARVAGSGVDPATFAVVRLSRTLGLHTALWRLPCDAMRGPANSTDNKGFRCR